MNRVQLLHAFLIAMARSQTDDVDHLLEELTEEINENDGCYTREETMEAMRMTQDEFEGWEEDPDTGTEEEDEDEVPYRDDPSDDEDNVREVDRFIESD